MTFQQTFNKIENKAIKKAIINNMKVIDGFGYHPNSKVPDHLNGIEGALSYAFGWKGSKEGLHFWDGVHEMFKHETLK